MQHNIKRKRVVLGEIQNVLAFDEKKSKGKRNLKKGIVCVKEENGSAIVVETESDDPQMCGAYASDIYDYLRNMEVGFRLNCFSILNLGLHFCDLVVVLFVVLMIGDELTSELMLKALLLWIVF